MEAQKKCNGEKERTQKEQVPNEEKERTQKEQVTNEENERTQKEQVPNEEKERTQKERVPNEEKDRTQKEQVPKKSSSSSDDHHLKWILIGFVCLGLWVIISIVWAEIQIEKDRPKLKRAEKTYCGSWIRTESSCGSQILVFKEYLWCKLSVLVIHSVIEN